MGKRGRKPKVEQLNLSIRTGNSPSFGLTTAVLKALGKPTSIEFWWSVSEKILLISASENESEYSFELPYNIYTVPKTRSKLYNFALLQKLCELYGWEKNTYAHFGGEYLPDLQMVAFKPLSIEIHE
jgi:hypothetical protein